MRFLLGVCALAALGSAASAQDGRGPLMPTGASTQRATGIAGQPTADSEPLSRGEAIARALVNNPLIEVARQQTAQARARRVTAVSVPDPALTYSYDQQPSFLNLGSATARNGAIGLLVPFPDKFRLRNAQATADVHNFEQNYRQQRQLIAFSTSQAYDSLLLAFRHEADLTEQVQLSQEFLKRTQARFNAGTAARLDVVRAQVDLAQSQNDLISNSLTVRTAVATLNRLMGRDINTPIRPTDSLTVPSALPDSSTIEQIALQNRPEIFQLQSQQAGARANTSLLKEQFVPDFTFQVSHDYTQPGSPVFSTGIAMPLPVFFWQHTNGDIAESQHHERELAASYQDLRNQIAWQVDSAYANASTTIRQVVFIRDQLLPSAREAYRIASVSYSIGGLSAIEVLQARRDLLAAQNQYAEALAAANTARADLELMLGTSLQNNGAGRP